MPERLSPSPLNPMCSPQAKRKKPSVPEKPAKKQKSGGETSRAGGSSRADGNRDDNLFQVLHLYLFFLTGEAPEIFFDILFFPCLRGNRIVSGYSYKIQATLKRLHS